MMAVRSGLGRGWEGVVDILKTCLVGDVAKPVRHD